MHLPQRERCASKFEDAIRTIKLVVGVWGFKGDTEKANARFERTQPDRLITSLAQAVVQIEALARLIARRNFNCKAAEPRALVSRDVPLIELTPGHRTAPASRARNAEIVVQTQLTHEAQPPPNSSRYRSQWR